VTRAAGVDRQNGRQVVTEARTRPFWRLAAQKWMKGAAHETCGGRSLNDDIVDTFLTLLVNAGNGPRIRGGRSRDRARLSRLPLPCSPRTESPRIESPRGSETMKTRGNDSTGLTVATTSEEFPTTAGILAMQNLQAQLDGQQAELVRWAAGRRRALKERGVEQPALCAGMRKD